MTRTKEVLGEVQTHSPRRDAGRRPIPRALPLDSIGKIEELLAQSRALLRPLRVVKVNVQLDGLPENVAGDMEGQLNAELRACGCGIGNVSGVIGLLGYCALIFARVGGPSNWRWKHLFIGMGFVVGAAVIGKLIGRLQARIRLTRKLESLLTEIRNPRGL